jgi:serine protease Do
MMRKYIWIIIIIGSLFSVLRADESDLYVVDAATVKASHLAVQSTVKITSDLLTHGSGFYISANEILTNQHVIESMTRIKISTYDNRTCSAKLLYQEKSMDLALLYTECTSKPLLIGTRYSIGQKALALGNPDIYEFMVTEGIVSGEGWQHILFDAPITQGSSGGPLVNIEGNAIGVVTRVDDKIGFIGYAITGKEAQRFIERARQ